MRIRSILLYVFILGICGCAKNAFLSGNVTFSEDDVPLTKGTVYFEQGTFIARGELNSAGYYFVGSLKQNDGIPPGTYRVYVDGAKEKIGMKSGMPEYRSLVDEKYRSGETSGLIVQVPTNNNRFDFKVERNTSK